MEALQIAEITTLPGVVDYTTITSVSVPTPEALLGRGLACLGEGDLAGARRAFGETRRVLETLEGPHPDRWLRLATAQARLARQRGSASDVAAYLRDGQRILERHGDRLETVTVAAHRELRAVMAIERGAHGLAERLLAEGLPGARSAGSSWSLRFHRLLGALHTRLGRPEEGAHHYRLALDLLDGEEQPAAAGALVANLAMCAFMEGRLDEAESRVLEALELKRASAAGPRANSLALLALVRTASGGVDTAGLWCSALELARESEDRTLIAEVELLAAGAAARAGDLEQARAWYDAAAAVSHRLRRQEPMIAAMALETEAVLARAAGRWEEAGRALARARAAFWEIGAVYHAAQVDAQRATIEQASGRSETAHARLEAACRLASRGGFELRGGEELAEALRAAGLRGHQGVRRYLEGRGSGLPPSSEGLLLDPRARVIVLDGLHHALGRDSKTYLLLRALLDARPRAVGAETLCRRLWPEDPFDRRVYGRLKVLVHRLRTLLDPDRHAVLTEPRAPRGGPARWRWNPDVPARIGRVDPDGDRAAEHPASGV